MHVALYSPAWPVERHPNGVVTYVHWLRKELLAQGHRVSVFTPVLDSACTDEGVHQVRFDLLYRLWYRFARLGKSQNAWVFGAGRPLAAQLARLHRRDPIDVIEMEETFGLARAVKQRLKIPVVLKLHGPAFLTLIEDTGRTPIARERIEREGAALAMVDAITSPSGSTLATTLAHYRLAPPIHKHVVNPVASARQVAIWNLDRCDRKTLLFVGRFDRPKGGDLVLRAFRRLLDRVPDARLAFAGPDRGVARDDGTTMHFDAFRDSVFEPPLRGCVTYLGQVEPAVALEWRTRAMATIVASRWENQAYTVLEAMLQGCPIVATDSGGTCELVVDGVTGRLVANEDVERLADAMAQMLENPQQAVALGRAARDYAQQYHSPQAVVRQTLAVYEQAIALAAREGVRPHEGSRPDVRVSRTRIALGVCASMLAVSAASFATRAAIAPSRDQAPPVVLERVVPAQFGEWKLQPASPLVVNPQTQQLLDQLYSQTLSRTYANAAGYRVMLSLAYGSDQRQGLQAHLPEVCYPAQGFTLRGQAEGQIATTFGAIPVKRLQTELGSRVEPVTYWLTMGDQVLQTRSRFEKRLIELRLGLTGNVPDGLLFRVSSIDTRPDNAFEMQERFVRDLLGALGPPERVRLAGLR